MLEIKNLVVKEGGFIETTYDASHSTPGRAGTCLELDISISQHQRMGKTWAEVTLRPELNTLDAGEALDKLADWAERLAIALRNRGPVTPVAVAFNDPQRPPEPERT